MRRNRMVKSQPPPGKLNPETPVPNMVMPNDISAMMSMTAGAPRHAPVINANVTASAQAAVPVLPGSGVNNAGAREIVALKQQVQTLASQVQQWQQILTEITQSVFVLNATVSVDNLPYYTELPATKLDLAGYTGRLSAHTRVTVMYPQLQRSDFIFMRLRLCDPHTGEVQQYYIPVANNGLTSQDLQKLQLVDGQYLDNFSNPGEALSA